MKIKKIFLTAALGVFSTFGSFGQFDLTITSAGVIAPVDGCYLSSSELVTIVVVNNQVTPYSGTIDISYSINFGPWVVETVTTAMPGNGTYIYSFTVNGDFSNCQIHNLDFAVYDINDIDNTNDSISVSIISDCAPVVGSIIGPDTLCSGINNDSLNLVGYTGNIVDWEDSPDGSTWSSLGSSLDVEYLVNLIPETYYQVIVASPYWLCPSDTASTYIVSVFAQSNAGVFPADFDICDNGNVGIVDVTGYVSSITDWLISNDGGTTWSSVGNTNDTLSYLDLTNTTMYEVIVVNGSCPADTSAAITLTLIPGSDAGTISGVPFVCNFENDSSLVVSGITGTVTAWYYSLDSGLTWSPTTQIDTIYYYTGLQSNTLFSVEVTLGSCLPDYSTHYITVLPINMSATATPNPITEGDTTVLSATPTSATNFLWFPDTFLSSTSGNNVNAWPDADFTYYVQVTDASGCIDTVSVLVTVLPNYTDLIVPNLITPNGDSYNDVWVIANIDTYPLNQVYIFNGYGQTVYESAPYNNDWEGTFNGGRLPDGTYYYLIRLNEPTAVQQDIQGVITIIGND